MLELRFITFSLVESVYPRKKDVHKNFLQTIMGDAERQVESKRVEQVVASGDVESDLRRALQVRVVFWNWNILGFLKPTFRLVESSMV